MRSSGTESRVHANDLLLYHDVLDTRDSQWQKLTYLAPSKTRHVSDVDVSCESIYFFATIDSSLVLENKTFQIGK